MTQPARARFTFEEYIALEEYSNVRHEFFDGQLFAMSGGTPEHAELAARCITLLSQLLRGRPCRVYSSDLRVRISATGLATYPDISVVCGPLVRDAKDANTVLNPILLVEILSESTAAYDRGEKFSHYKQIDTLQEYMLVCPWDKTVEIRTRPDPDTTSDEPGGGWKVQSYGVEQTVVLARMGIQFSGSELFVEQLPEQLKPTL